MRLAIATTIAVLSQKGGTGKTTTIRMLADVLRRIDYAPDLGADYLALADELLGRLGFVEERRRLACVRRELAPACAPTAACSTIVTRDTPT